MMKKQEYITPSKNRPVFIAECTDFGYLTGEDLYDSEGDLIIYKPFYKNWFVQEHKEGGGLRGETFATSYLDAINYLINFIKDYKALTGSTKYIIYMFEGKLDKWGSGRYKKVYTLTEMQAKKYRIK